MQKITYLLISVILAALIVAGCGGKDSASLGKDEVAKVGSSEITRAEFEAQLKAVETTYKSQGQDLPTGKAKRDLENQILDSMIQNEIVLQAADKQKLKVSDKQIEKQVKEIKDLYFQGDKKAFADELKKQGLTEKTMRERLKSTLTMQKLQEKVTKDIKVSDEEIKTYYDVNKKDFLTPKQRDIAHILVKNSAEMKKVSRELAAGKDFTALAKKYSLDQATKTNGGKLTANAGQLVPAFEKAAFALKNQEISRPVKTEFGLHIIKALGPVKPASAKTLAEATDQIKATLQGRAQSEKLTEYIAKLRRDADVKVAKGYSWKLAANKAS